MSRIFAMFSASVFLFACSNNNSNTETTTPDNSQPDQVQPAVIGYQLLKTYPHDSSAYTEGLQYVNGKLLESTGEYGQSDIRYVDLNSGKVLQKATLSNEFFGEGCTLLDGKIFQMTYKENTCFVYDPATLRKTGEFNYGFGEGWGMTTDGKQLIISTGSSNLYFYDPVSFKEIKRLGVTNQYGPVGNINELELIKGFIYANIYQADTIVKIDTASGKVVGVVNLDDLRGKLGLPSKMGENGPEVLNGIAYDTANNRIFITGKYWPKLCEVKFDN